MKRKLAGSLLLAVSISFAIPVQVSAMSEDQVMELSNEIGAEYGICPELLQAVSYYESGYDEKAENEGCSGVMQVSEKWHGKRMERLGVKDLYDPEDNMRVAADYLAELFEDYEDAGMVLMVYNGDSRAERYWGSGEDLSEYAQNILTMAEKLERDHGK